MDVRYDQQPASTIFLPYPLPINIFTAFIGQFRLKNKKLNTLPEIVVSYAENSFSCTGERENPNDASFSLLSWVCSKWKNRPNGLRHANTCMLWSKKERWLRPNENYVLTKYANFFDWYAICPSHPLPICSYIFTILTTSCSIVTYVGFGARKMIRDRIILIDTD